MKIKKIIATILVFVLSISIYPQAQASSENTILLSKLNFAMSSLKNGNEIELDSDVVKSLIPNSELNNYNFDTESSVKINKTDLGNDQFMFTSSTRKDEVYSIGFKESHEVPDGLPELNTQNINMDKVIKQNNVILNSNSNMVKNNVNNIERNNQFEYNDDTLNDILVETINFSFYESEEDAKSAIDEYNIEGEQYEESTPLLSATSTSPPYMNTNFWHGSSIKLYYSVTNGYYYKIHLSAVDCNYIISMSWLIVGTIVTLICLCTGIIGSVIAILIGAVIVGAIITYYWIYQNSDGSLDIYIYWNNIPNWAKLVGYSSYTLCNQAYLGYIKISNYYKSLYYEGETTTFELE